MSLYGSDVECGLHCLLYLVDPPDGPPPSSRDLAEFQGVSPSLVAKLFTRLQKAGIVMSAEGVRGGFQLARPADQISVLDVVDALDKGQPLFQCREIRANCVLYADDPPSWADRGVCSVHAVMLEAERRMRAALGEHTLAGIAAEVNGKVPARFITSGKDWFRDRGAGRRRAGTSKTPQSEIRS